MIEETLPDPQIIVAFQNYTPPFDAEKTVRRMLGMVPPKYLWGLHAVVLTNVGALSRKDRNRRAQGRRRARTGESLGYYIAA